MTHKPFLKQNKEGIMKQVIIEETQKAEMLGNIPRDALILVGGKNVKDYKGLIGMMREACDNKWYIIPVSGSAIGPYDTRRSLMRAHKRYGFYLV